MKNKSIWIENINTTPLKSLKKDIVVDVLIIGGGLTGISTAFYLKDSNLKIALIDQDKIGYGISSRTTGKLTYLQELIYGKLEKNFNFNISKLYLDSQKDAIKLVVDNVKKYKIDCNLTKNTSYTLTNDKSQINKFKQEEAFLKRAKVNYDVCDKLPIDYPCKYAIKVDDTYVFHPLKYITKLKSICLEKDIQMYENTRALNIKKEKNYYICETNTYNIKAKKIVVSCHYPFFIKPLFIPFKTHIQQAWVGASKVQKTNKFNAITNTNPIKSIRYHEDEKKYFIYIANSHKLCDELDRKAESNKLEKELKRLNKKADYIWINQDIMSNDNLPLIGQIKKDDKNLLIGTAYNTWGMTNATIAGKVLSDIILGNKNRYINLFNPHRPISMNKFKNLFLNSYFNGKAFVLTKLKKNYPWYKSNVKFEVRDGKNVGIYTDEKGVEHVIHNLCPHLKCSLIFNETEKTWDCPCHGSRFDIDGNVIIGPSTYNIKI